MKTHEIGIGSFASVMINGERKTVRQQRAKEEGERLCVFFFRERRSNVRNHVFLIMKAQKNNKTGRTNEKKTQRQVSRFLMPPNKYLHTNNLISWVSIH